MLCQEGLGSAATILGGWRACTQDLTLTFELDSIFSESWFYWRFYPEMKTVLNLILLLGGYSLVYQIKSDCHIYLKFDFAFFFFREEGL